MKSYNKKLDIELEYKVMIMSRISIKLLVTLKYKRLNIEIYNPADIDGKEIECL